MERAEIKIAQGKFSSKQSTTSSTHRELLAVEYVLNSFKFLSNETLQWHTDNHNLTQIIQKGSSKQDFQKIVIRNIYKLSRN